MDRPAVADYPAGARLSTRAILDFEFVWMLRGRATVVPDNGPELELAPGRLLLVPPALKHGFRWDPAGPSRHGYVHFGPDDVGMRVPPALRLVRMTDDDPLAGLCAYLLWLAGLDEWLGPGRRILEVMVRLTGSGPLPDQLDHPLPAGLRTCLDFLRREWARPPLRRIDVNELAAEGVVSRAHLTRLFQAEFGLSPATALTRLRCARAETLLSRTDLTADVIAQHCGFADLSHFTHRFTALHGIPPGRYRAAGDARPSVLDHPGVRRLARRIWD
jgi:AraC-like DNA-binding protein